MNIEDIYTPLEEAKKEIWKRWNDKELEKKVNKFLEGNIPEVLLKEPRAISTAHVATPNNLFLKFLDQAKQASLKPLVFEYLDDVFVTTNFGKASLAKMVFCQGRDCNGNIIKKNHFVIDLTGKEEKKKICDVKTLWNENLVDFHHRVLNEFCGGVELYDGSTWYKNMGEHAKKYYPYILALYLRNGILFENFVFKENHREKEFTEQVVIPAFEMVLKEFKLKPLIVSLLPLLNEGEKTWEAYPGDFESIIKKVNN